MLFRVSNPDFSYDPELLIFNTKTLFDEDINSGTVYHLKRYQASMLGKTEQTNYDIVRRYGDEIYYQQMMRSERNNVQRRIHKFNVKT